MWKTFAYGICKRAIEQTRRVVSDWKDENRGAVRADEKLALEFALAKWIACTPIAIIHTALYWARLYSVYLPVVHTCCHRRYFLQRGRAMKISFLFLGWASLNRKLFSALCIFVKNFYINLRLKVNNKQFCLNKENINYANKMRNYRSGRIHYRMSDCVDVKVLLFNNAS